jgi:hypothetical protein
MFGSTVCHAPVPLSFLLDPRSLHKSSLFPGSNLGLASFEHPRHLGASAVRGWSSFASMTRAIRRERESNQGNSGECDGSLLSKDGAGGVENHTQDRGLFDVL